MFIFEKTYDFNEMTRNNMHTHSSFSLCAKPEMVLPAIVAEAERCGIETLAITDHSNIGDGIDVYANSLIHRKMLKQINPKIRVLIGAELSAYGVGKFVEPYEVDKSLDYCNYSHVHYHMPFWEHPEDKSPRGYAQHMLDVLSALFETDRADCIAHPFSPSKLKFFSEEEKLTVLSSITDNELGDILEKGEKAQCAWEIHFSTFTTYTDFSRRYFNLGRETGVHFNFGTDAHVLRNLSTAGCAQKLYEVIK